MMLLEVASGGGVRLTIGRGTLKRRQFGAGPLDVRDPRIDGWIHAESARAMTLGHEADIGQRGRVADAKVTAARRPRKHFLEGTQTSTNPLAKPGLECSVVSMQGALQESSDGSVLQRLHVGDHDLSERTHPGALAAVARQ
jgi:hypothetical protein